MGEKSAGVYGFMVSNFSLFLSLLCSKPKTPRCAHVTTHAVFVSRWPLAAARFMSLIPGSAPSIHFAAVLSSQPNIKLLPIAQNAVSQRDVCIWHHVLSGDQPEMNNRCPWLHHCLCILCRLFNSRPPYTHHNSKKLSANTNSDKSLLVILMWKCAFLLWSLYLI